MTTKFTPGPWEVDFENCHTGQVATCHGYGEGYYEVWSRRWMEHGIDQKANAHLIAAAPDLYAALKEIMDGRAMDSDLREQCRSALAKARGERQ